MKEFLSNMWDRVRAGIGLIESEADKVAAEVKQEMPELVTHIQAPPLVIPVAAPAVNVIKPSDYNAGDDGPQHDPEPPEAVHVAYPVEISNVCNGPIQDVVYMTSADTFERVTWWSGKEVARKPCDKWGNYEAPTAD